MKKIIFVLLVITALACGTSRQEPNIQRISDSPKQEIGQDIIVGDIRWKVLEVKDLGTELKSDNQFREAKTTSGKFVLIRVEVENRKDKAATYAGIELVDGKARTFEHYSEQFGFIEDSERCILEQLNPNISRVCSEIFELPADATALKVKLGDLEMFGGNESLVELGF